MVPKEGGRLFWRHRSCCAKLPTAQEGKGILEDLDPNKGGRSLPDDIKQRVIAFYESEDSRICPGKKEFVVVRDGGMKSHKQKQLLLLNLHELYVAYKATVDSQPP